MLSGLRGLVSGQSRRYKADGYDLDLSYITDRVIAMSYPFEGHAELYRNPLKTVRRLLDSRYKCHYRLFNLCSERCYDHSKFECPVSTFPFEDHQAPPLPLMSNFVEQVAAWLKQHPANMAVVHCKAGKGRTGTMVCAYLLYEGICKTADEALDLYAAKRTMDGNGVTNPSQRRYVRYFADVVRNGQPKIKQLQLTRIVLAGLSDHDLNELIVIVKMRPPGAGWKTELVCLAASNPQQEFVEGVQPSNHNRAQPATASTPAETSLSQQNQPLQREGATAVLACQQPGPATCWQVQGDLHIQVFKGKVKSKHCLAWTWFNTAFVPLQQEFNDQNLDHSKSLSAGSLTPCMYHMWTKVLKLAMPVREGIHVKVELSPVDGG